MWVAKGSACLVESSTYLVGVSSAARRRSNLSVLSATLTKNLEIAVNTKIGQATCLYRHPSKYCCSFCSLKDNRFARTTYIVAVCHGFKRGCQSGGAVPSWRTNPQTSVKFVTYLSLIVQSPSVAHCQPLPLICGTFVVRLIVFFSDQALRCINSARFSKAGRAICTWATRREEKTGINMREEHRAATSARGPCVQAHTSFCHLSLMHVVWIA